MKLKSVFILFLLFLPLTAAGRFIQLYEMINPSTGFFYPEYSAVNLIMGIFFAVLMLALFIFSFRIKNSSNEKLQKSPLLTAAGLVMALALLVELGSKAASAALTPFLIFEMALILLTAAAFCIYAVSNIADINVNPGLLMIFPVILWIFRLISYFLAFTGMANISENIITILMVCASMIFLLNHGKLAAGLTDNKTVHLTVGTGMVSAVLCTVSALPRYIMYFVDKTKLHEGALGNIMDIALAFYIVCFVYVCLKRRASEPKNYDGAERESCGGR